ncbi:MAG: MFS transporter [Sedimentisphaerales bacterium]|nr:MFS transporter [Sedimentisphaerales bacterium]
MRRRSPADGHELPEDALRPPPALGHPRTALKFVVLLGVVSLFADLTYEGARSAVGRYLGILGASAAAVGIVAGLGELVGYALRLVSGYLSDRTGRYWAITITGYTVNLLAVPLLALARRWELAAALIILERIGKALRTPARDAMLSHATGSMGRGWAFGLHEALDQVGAVLGPLVVAAVLYAGGGYRTGFAILLAPGLVALAVLIAARRLYPRPQDLEMETSTLHIQGMSRLFWLYLAGVALIAAGFADFPLIAFHFGRAGVVSEVWIPTLYAVAMGADAISALVFGRLFDRLGFRMLLLATVLSALVAPLVFLGDFYAALLGMGLWGIGMGAQESIMRAAVASMATRQRRGTAYGIFNTGYGLAWFLGSALMGILYNLSLPALIAFSVGVQLLSLPLMLMVARRQTQMER